MSDVPSGGQAAVAAIGTAREQPTLETFYSGFGPGFGGWYWGGWGSGGYGDNSRHLIWRGLARQVLSGSPEKNKDKLAHAVADMFKKFPPPSRS